jgi:hypothetical protein
LSVNPNRFRTWAPPVRPFRSRIACTFTHVSWSRIAGCSPGWSSCLYFTRPT